MDRPKAPFLLKRRVQQRLGDLGINPFEAARRGGLERNFINDILNEKKVSVRGDNLAKLARGLSCPPAYFFDEDFDLPEETCLTELPEMSSAIDMIAIPEYDVRLSAGAGHLIEVENIKDIWQFSRRYIEGELRLNRANLAVVEVEGDSMEPTLRSGDRVLIDHSDRNPAKPGIYAIWDSNATVVKRVENIPASDPPQLVLISDNKNHHEYIVLAEFVNVIGRVVWFARRL